MTSSMVTATDLEITEDEGEEGTLLHLRGRLSIDSSPAFRDLLLDTLRRQLPPRIIVDLTEVSYMDASGVATLVEGLKAARNRQIALCLRGLQGRVRHLFEVTGLLTLFETSDPTNSSSEARVS